MKPKLNPDVLAPAPSAHGAGVAAGQVLAALPHGAWVAVIRLRSLGDIILTTPALAALRRWRPDLRVVYLAEPRWTAALAGNPDIAQVIAVPGGGAGRLAALRTLRRLRPRLAVNLHGGSTAAWLTWGSGAQWRAGFVGHRHGWAVNLRMPPQPPPPGRWRWHTAEHVAGLFRFLGLPPGELGPARVVPAAAARPAVAARLAAAGVAGPYAFINAFPREAAMRWRSADYAALLPWLRARWGLAAVLAHPAAPDAETAAPLLAAGARLLAPTTVAELIAIIAGAEIVIGSDGGPLHIAAALGKPVVALFGPTDREAWAPWQARHRLLMAPATEVPYLEVQQAVNDLLAVQTIAPDNS